MATVGGASQDQGGSQISEGTLDHGRTFPRRVGSGGNIDGVDCDLAKLDLLLRFPTSSQAPRHFREARSNLRVIAIASRKVSS